MSGIPTIETILKRKKHTDNKRRHLFGFIPAVARRDKTTRRGHQVSAWKEHKHLNAPRHISRRGKQ